MMNHFLTAEILDHLDSASIIKIQGINGDTHFAAGNVLTCRYPYNSTKDWNPRPYPVHQHGTNIVNLDDHEYSTSKYDITRLPCRTFKFESTRSRRFFRYKKPYPPYPPYSFYPDGVKVSGGVHLGHLADGDKYKLMTHPTNHNDAEKIVERPQYMDHIFMESDYPLRFEDFVNARSFELAQAPYYAASIDKKSAVLHIPDLSGFIYLRELTIALHPFQNISVFNGLKKVALNLRFINVGTNRAIKMEPLAHVNTVKLIDWKTLVSFRGCVGIKKLILVGGEYSLIKRLSGMSGLRDLHVYDVRTKNMVKNLPRNLMILRFNAKNCSELVFSDTMLSDMGLYEFSTNAVKLPVNIAEYSTIRVFEFSSVNFSNVHILCKDLDTVVLKISSYPNHNPHCIDEWLKSPSGPRKIVLKNCCWRIYSLIRDNFRVNSAIDENMDGSKILPKVIELQSNLHKFSLTHPSRNMIDLTVIGCDCGVCKPRDLLTEGYSGGHMYASANFGDGSFNI